MANPYLDLLLGAQVQEDGTKITPRRWLNFSTGFNVVEDPDNDRLTLTASSAAIELGGDLSGTPEEAEVVGLTGTSNIIAWHGTTIKGDDFATNGGTAPTHVIQASNATGTTSTGGTLDLVAGTGTSSAGAVNIKIGSTARLSVAANGTLSLSAYGDGVLQSNGAGVVSSTALLPSRISPGSLGQVLGVTNSPSAAATWISNVHLSTAGLRLGDSAAPTERLDVVGRAKVGAGAGKVIADSFIGAESTFGGLWMGDITPSTDNYVLNSNADDLNINAPGASGSIYFKTNEAATITGRLTATGLRLGDNNPAANRLEVAGTSLFTDFATFNSGGTNKVIIGPHPANSNLTGLFVGVTPGASNHTMSFATTELQFGVGGMFMQLTAAGLRVGDGASAGAYIDSASGVRAGSGAGKALLNSMAGLTATHGAVWLGAITPDATNEALVSDGADTTINGTSSVQIAVGSVPHSKWNATGLAIGSSSDPVTSLTVTKAASTFPGTNATSHQVLENTGTQTHLMYSFSGTPKGDVRMDSAGTFSYHSTHATVPHIWFGALDLTQPLATLGPAGLRISSTSSGAASAKLHIDDGDILLSSTSNRTISMPSTASATGGKLTVQAQNAGTTGGNLELKSGTGGTAPGDLVFSHGSDVCFIAQGAGTARYVQISGGTSNGIFLDADVTRFRTTGATYKGNWSTTGLRIGDSTAAAATLDVQGPAMIGKADVSSVHQIIGGQRWTTRAVASNTTIDSSTKDMILLVDSTSATVTVTLPAPAIGRVVTIKRWAGSNNIVIDRNSTNIDNYAENWELLSTEDVLPYITLVSDGANWFIIDHHGAFRVVP